MSATTANPSDYDDDEEGLSGFTILAILATLILVFIVVVWYAYRQGVASATSSSEALPVVAADPRPVAKELTADGSPEPTRQEVYDRVSGALETRIVTAEEPGQDALNGYGGAPQRMAERPAEAAAADPETTTAPSAREPEAQQTAAAAEPERSSPVPSQKPLTAAAQTQQPPAAAPAAAAVVATHVVQVGAFDSNKAALDYFDTLSGRLTTLLSGKRPDVQQATVNGREYHRLRIGPFTSKSDADAYCAQLKANGQDCLVRGV